MTIKSDDTAKLRDFWNKTFDGYTPSQLSAEDCLFGEELDGALEFMCNNCTSIVDYGCGMGGFALACARQGADRLHMCGIDTSPAAIAFAEGCATLTKLTNTSFVVGGIEELRNTTGIDGIICSNVLDVITPDECAELIECFTDVLPTSAYLMLKFNFFLTDEIIERTGMLRGENGYYRDGVLRCRNQTDEEWISMFPAFRLVASHSFQRAETLPPDRVFILQKI